jgi:N-acylneuraminate cytidylyltransferase
MLAIIPARGGSKGLPRKNILPAGGKPLIAWTINAAHGANCVTRLILSSEDVEIADTARRYGCDVPFLRPHVLAEDTTTSMAVVLHAIAELPGYDYVALLQPTSPLRTANDIDAAFALLTEAKAPACVSLSPVVESPYWMYHLANENRLKPILAETGVASRRQDLPAVYSLNGAIYIAKIDWLLRTKSFLSDETVGFVMPLSRSLDIDTEQDYKALLDHFAHV